MTAQGHYGPGGVLVLEMRGVMLSWLVNPPSAYGRAGSGCVTVTSQEKGWCIQCHALGIGSKSTKLY